MWLRYKIDKKIHGGKKNYACLPPVPKTSLPKFTKEH